MKKKKTPFGFNIANGSMPSRAEALVAMTLLQIVRSIIKSALRSSHIGCLIEDSRIANQLVAK